MIKQFCRACGSEVFSNNNLPLDFCTNCGARLMPHTQPNTPNYPTVPFQTRGAAKLSGKEKSLFGLLIAIPVLLIIGGIGVFIFLFYSLSQRQQEFTDYNPPRSNYPSSSKTPTSQNLLLTVGKEGFGQGEFKKAESIAVDKDGNIYVGDATFRVQKFDPSGKFLMLWNVTEGKTKADERYSNAITHLAVDSKNRVYVVAGREDLLRYDGTTGKFIDKITLQGEKWVNQAQEARVMDMVMLNDDHLAIYATSFPRAEMLMMVSPDGKATIKHKDLLKKQSGDSIPTLTNGSLLVSVTGEIFLMDNMPSFKKAYILRFKPDGSYVDRFTWSGAPSSAIFSRKIIALNSKGEIYAYDDAGNKINVLNIEGVPQRTIPLNDTYFEQMILDKNDNIYIVSDKKVEKFSATGS